MMNRRAPAFPHASIVLALFLTSVTMTLFFATEPAEAALLNEFRPWSGSTGVGDSLPSLVEVFNETGSTQDLTGWQLGGATNADSVVLPGWMLPSGAYLTVIFGPGTNDSDFTDGIGAYFDDTSGFVLTPESGELGLYFATRSDSSIVDFVGWGLGGSTFGDAYDHALTATIWSPGDYVDITGLSLLGHVARIPSGYDTNAPADWLELEQSFVGPLTAHNAIQLAPRDGTLNTSVASLDWKSVSGASDYYVEVDDDPAFGSPVIATTVGGTSYAVALADGAYYWRVTPTLTGGPYPAAIWSFAQSGTISKQMPFSALPQRFQHKDSPLLCDWNNQAVMNNAGAVVIPVGRPGCTELAGAVGPWDAAHAMGAHIPGCRHCNQYCTRASIQMVNHKFLGSLTQDEISYQLWVGANPGPEGDLGHGIGAWPAGAYSWALSGAAVARTGQGRAPNPYVNPTGMPWNVLTTQINADRPVLAVIEPPGWFHTVVYSGYFEIFGFQFAFITDPWPGRTSFYVNSRIHVVEYHTLPAGAIQGRQSHADIGTDTNNDRFVDTYTDTDGDGVLDFDEGSPRNFQSFWYDQDSDADGILDKPEIRSYTFHDADHANHNNDALNFPDVDGDGKRAEFDCDTDADRDYDNGEDINGNGNSPQAGETCVYRITDRNLTLTVFNNVLCAPQFQQPEIQGGTLARNKTYNVEVKQVTCTPPDSGAALTADATIQTNAQGNVSVNNFACLTPGQYRLVIDAVQDGVFDPGCDPVLCDTIVGPTAVTGLFALGAIPGEDRIEIEWGVRTRDEYSGFHVLRSADGGPYERLTAAPIPSAADEYPATLRWVDASAREGVLYEYRIEVIHPDGTPEVWQQSVTARVLGRAPLAFSLRVTGPNPFRGREGIGFEYGVPRPGADVAIAVFDATGRRVATLVEGRVEAGTREGAWRGPELDRLASGIYLMRMEAGNYRASERIVLVN